VTTNKEESSGELLEVLPSELQFKGRSVGLLKIE
jgi:hypothetical protein